MTPGMEWLLIAWGVVTGILLILLFYRSTLTSSLWCKSGFRSAKEGVIHKG